MRVARWSVETLNEIVDRELDALPADMRARFVRISDLIVAVGLERVREPHVKHLGGPLWEMRVTGRDGTARALYVTARERRARRRAAKFGWRFNVHGRCSNEQSE